MELIFQSKRINKTQMMKKYQRLWKANQSARNLETTNGKKKIRW